MADSKDQLSILVDVRSRLDELVKTQKEFAKLSKEVRSTEGLLKTGFGIDFARRGLDVLTSSVKQFVGEAFRMAGVIKDGAQNLEMSNRAYQVMGNLLKDAGGDVSQLTQAISTNNRSLVEARTLGSAAAGAYRTLGLDVAKLEQMPTERRFELIGKAVLSATDKTQAYDAASKILGTRGLPTLLGALRDLATEGWDKVADSQARSGRILTDDTIARLDAASKSIEKLKQSITIGFGESIGLGGQIADSFTKDKIGTFMAMLHAMTGTSSGLAHLAATVTRNVPAAAAPAPSDGGSASAIIALKNNLAKAEYNLAAAMLHRQTVEGDPTRTDYQKKQQLIGVMQEELVLREKLVAATLATPLGDTETAESRNLAIRKLEEQNKQLRNQLNRLQYGTGSYDRDQATRDGFAQHQDEGGRLNLGGTASLAGMDWVTNLGSQAQQVSGLIQSTLGTTVQGISSGIYGWATGTQSFGSAMLQLGDSVFRAFLDTIIQMGVQWLVTQLLIKTGMVSTHVLGETLRVQRMTATAAEGAAATASMAPAAATSSIASFGVAAALGVAALIAAMALFGGFATGGYTGDMPTNQVAGVVHGQEGVLNAPAMRRLGIANLNALNAGQPISAPAAFGGSGEGISGGASGSGGANVSVAVFMDETAAMAWLGSRTGKKVLYRKLGQDRGELGLNT